MVISKWKKIILVLFLGISFHIFPVYATEIKESVSLTENESGEVEEKKMTFLEDLHYRIIYKDTKDFFDWVLLGTAIVALLIVMVFQNTHYVIIVRPLEENSFLEKETSYNIEEVGKNKVEETLEVAVAEVKEETDTNPEILSSDLLEEEKEQVPKKKKNKNKKKKRA